MIPLWFLCVLIQFVRKSVQLKTVAVSLFPLAFRNLQISLWSDSCDYLYISRDVD